MVHAGDAGDTQYIHQQYFHNHKFNINKDLSTNIYLGKFELI